MQRLDAGGQQGEDDLLDLEFVHLPQSSFVDVEQFGASAGPRLRGEVLLRLLDDVRVGGAEVLVEGDLLHGCS